MLADYIGSTKLQAMMSDGDFGSLMFYGLIFVGIAIVVFISQLLSGTSAR